MGPIALALAVIRELTDHPYGITLQDLAGRLRRTASTLQRVMRVLEDQHLVVRSAGDRSYLLGPATIELADRIATTLTDSVADTTVGRVLAAAATRTGETVVVARPTESGPAVVVAAAPSPHPLRVCVRVGSRLPLAGSSVGRVLLAWHERAEIAALLAARPPAPGPITLLDLFDQHARIRDRGYDTGTDEFGAGTWAVTAPVRSPAGAVTGALTLAVPSSRAAPAQHDDLTTAALDIAALLGAHPADAAEPGSWAPGP